MNVKCLQRFPPAGWARPRTAAIIVTVLIAAAIAGCGSMTGDAGFRDLQQQVGDRTGARIHWLRGGPEDRAVAEAIEGMLEHELTADQAVQIALLNNRALQGTYEDLMVAQADLVGAGLLRNPIFSAEVRFVEGGGGPALDFSLIQHFLDIVFIPMRERIAKSQFESARHRVTAEITTLASHTRAAFHELQGRLHATDTLQKIVEASAASYELAWRLHDAGNITELELAIRRASHEMSKVELAAAQAGVLQTRERLNAHMGFWGMQTQWTLAPRLPELPPEEQTTEHIERLVISRNSGLAAAEREIDSVAAVLGIARPLAAWGDIEAGVAAEREADRTWSIGPAIAFPLPIFDRGHPAQARARAEFRRAVQQHAAAAVELRGQARAAHITLLAARARAEYYQKVMLPLRERIVNEAVLQYNAMQIGTFELLQFKEEQLRAEIEHIDAKREYWLARAELERLTGGMLGIDPSVPDTQTPAAAGDHSWMNDSSHDD
jgi:outer membrane protein, heavy metal efflux system